MPIIKSAKKRVRVSRKATVANAKTKRSLKAAVKSLHQASVAKDSKQTQAALKKAQSQLARAQAKGVMHKNKVARKQSQLAKLAKRTAGRTTTKKRPTATK